MRLAILAVAALALGACGGPVGINTTNGAQLSADISCRTIGATLQNLTLYRHKMKPADILRVDTLAAESYPLCFAPNPPTGEDVIARINQIRMDLLAAEGAAR